MLAAIVLGLVGIVLLIGAQAFLRFFDRSSAMLSRQNASTQPHGDGLS
jgi:hypothetical protein